MNTKNELNGLRTEKTHSNTFGYAEKVHEYETEEAKLSRILGRPFIEYRNRWKAISNGEIIPEFPIHLNFELIYGCNLECPMCLTTSKEFIEKNSKGEKVIPLEKFKEIIDEGAQNGLGSIALNGFNEPFLLRSIFDYIRYAKEKKIPDIYLSTNGMILNERIAEQILESGLTRIWISIDAITPDTYKIVRKGGKYDRVVKNILYLLKIREEKGCPLPIIRTSFVRSKINQYEEERFVDFWKGKTDSVMIQNFSNPYLEQSGYKELEEQYRIDFSEPMEECLQPFQRLFIGSTGNVYPCCSDYGQKMVMGNIYENSIKEIWSGKRMASLKETVNAEHEQQPKACQLCRGRQSCQ